VPEPKPAPKPRRARSRSPPARAQETKRERSTERQIEKNMAEPKAPPKAVELDTKALEPKAKAVTPAVSMPTLAEMDIKCCCMCRGAVSDDKNLKDKDNRVLQYTQWYYRAFHGRNYCPDCLALVKTDPRPNQAPEQVKSPAMFKDGVWWRCVLELDAVADNPIAEANTLVTAQLAAIILGARHNQETLSKLAEETEARVKLNKAKDKWPDTLGLSNTTPLLSKAFEKNEKKTLVQFKGRAGVAAAVCVQMRDEHVLRILSRTSTCQVQDFTYAEAGSTDRGAGSTDLDTIHVDAARRFIHIRGKQLLL